MQGQSTLTFVPAEAEDFPILFQLNRQLIEEYEDLETIDLSRVLNWVQHNIQTNLPYFTRVLRQGQLVGYFCLMPSGEKTELDSLFVLPAFRQQGIGTEILKRCLQRSPGAVFLYAFRKNTGAIALYQRMGFQHRKNVGQTRCIMEYQKQDC